jgi:signal transduction histidine kinase
VSRLRSLVQPFARASAFWLAIGVCASVTLLTGLGYRAVMGWQRAAMQLASSRASETADLLATALARDMRAVQGTVLTSAHWDEFMLDAPYDVRMLSASAFARYPYPESFFAWRGPGQPMRLTFFNRADRPPPWNGTSHERERFPVAVAWNDDTSRALASRIGADVARRRRFSMFEASLGGVPYQIVVRLMYRDSRREQLAGIYGFTVNLRWVREHYFQEVTRQVSRIGGVPSGYALLVVDDRNAIVAGGTRAAHRSSKIRRTFAFTFFDPLLIALDPPIDLPSREWAVEVEELAGSPVAAVIRGAHRTLVAVGLSGATLALGLVLTARAVRARARLADMRSDFVSTVTHELKTPIATIRAIGDTLVTGRVSEPHAMREYAQLLVHEAKRLTRLVDNLLAYARITDVTEAYSFEPVSPAHMVDQVVRRFSSQLAERGFRVTVDVPPGLAFVRADRTAMELLLDNVVDNAIRYSGEERVISIDGREDDATVMLAIADRGGGIPGDELPLVTRRFFRGRRASSGGSGLGLAIASRIVDDHHGTLEITSQPGQGTTVTIRLPRAGAQDD